MTSSTSTSKPPDDRRELRRFVGRISAVALAIYLASSALGVLMDQSLVHSKFYKPYLDAHEGQLRDAEMLIFGGSRALTGINAKEIGRALGLKAYNLGLDDTAIGSHLLLLELMTKRGIRPRVVLLEYYNHSASDAPVWSTNDFRFLPLLNSAREVRDYVLEKKGPVYMYGNAAFPWFKYSYFNEELLFPALATLRSREMRYRSDELGDYAYPASQETEMRGTGASGEPPAMQALNTGAREYREFVDFCRKIGAVEVTYVAPVAGVHVQTSDSSIINYSLLNIPPAEFADRQHVNAKGRARVSAALAEEIKRRYFSGVARASFE